MNNGQIRLTQINLLSCSTSVGTHEPEVQAPIISEPYLWGNFVGMRGQGWICILDKLILEAKGWRPKVTAGDINARAAEGKVH